MLVDAAGHQRIGYAFSFLRVDGLEADLRKIGAEETAEKQDGPTEGGVKPSSRPAAQIR